MQLAKRGSTLLKNLIRSTQTIISKLWLSIFYFFCSQGGTSTIRRREIHYFNQQGMTLDKKEKERLYGRSWPGSVLQERFDTFLGGGWRWRDGAICFLLCLFCFCFFSKWEKCLRITWCLRGSLCLSRMWLWFKGGWNGMWWLAPPTVIHYGFRQVAV